MHRWSQFLIDRGDLFNIEVSRAVYGLVIAAVGARADALAAVAARHHGPGNQRQHGWVTSNYDTRIERLRTYHRGTP
ncbi:hypothetical protein ETB97_000744 [Aspergillus alliaceus]|uniref:Uncharacterized protein n=1 Tax=Petromyces alliaceus TaxID=209559 RepID=A0A8H6A5Q8_PETAA|nr:hypothetical protein ETB97_000744 [Aspergillus burnettii]